MTLPAALAAVLTAQLNATLEDIRPVGGGNISQAVRVFAGGRMYLLISLRPTTNRGRTTQRKGLQYPL